MRTANLRRVADLFRDLNQRIAALPYQHPPTEEELKDMLKQLYGYRQTLIDEVEELRPDEYDDYSNTYLEELHTASPFIGVAKARSVLDALVTEPERRDQIRERIRQWENTMELVLSQLFGPVFDRLGRTVENENESSNQSQKGPNLFMKCVRLMIENGATYNSIPKILRVSEGWESLYNRFGSQVGTSKLESFRNSKRGWGAALEIFDQSEKRLSLKVTKDLIKLRDELDADKQSVLDVLIENRGDQTA